MALGAPTPSPRRRRRVVAVTSSPPRRRCAASASPHLFLAGGLPGYFPPIAGRAGFGQVGFNLYDPFNWFDSAYPGKDKARGRQVEINNGRAAMLGIFMMLSESAVPGAVPPLTLINYIVDASGLTELNWPSLDLPVIGQVGGWAFLNSFPQYTPSDDLSIVTALSQFSTPGNALNP